MVIGIDGNEANVDKRVGISEYSFELLRHFYENQKSILRQRSGQEIKNQNHNLKFKIYLKNKPYSDFPKEEVWWQYSIFGPTKLWTQFALPLNLYLERPRPDVFFSPTHYAPRFSPVPTVISIMDLSYIHFPQLFKKSDLYQLKNWTSYSLHNAKKVLTISKASRNDIIKEYKVAEDKVVVTYPGIKSEIRNPRFAARRAKFETNTKYKKQMKKTLKDKYGINGEYILFVGTLQPRKNIERLIEAFSLLCHPKRSEGSRDSSPANRRAQNDIQLVIVGKKGWLYEDILKAPKKFEIKDKVKFLDFVSDEDLPGFYENAICFVLPSLYEGFGLPVLEAMKYGCPVITSSVSSLPEAGGDAALYINPLDVEDIAKNLELIINNSELRKKLIEKGYEQVKKFSWEKTARETLDVLTQVANNGKNY
ncbi:MAG: hypothetical protein A2687_01885 [Candidatus Levybacteria bacterium RIFCSPHIGHO2_01_FULL_38_26]|nr:MAG: hypothetical protein A2687_01885 [Candidatus Levybacteria bacterium RIFCSPHIGHO2_01_FULL_38_26]